MLADLVVAVPYSYRDYTTCYTELHRMPRRPVDSLRRLRGIRMSAPTPRPTGTGGGRPRGGAVARPRPTMQVDLRCTCGGTLRGTVSPSTAVMKIRDVYLSFHRGDEHAVTDSSEDIS